MEKEETQASKDYEKRRRCFEQDVKTMTREELIEAMEILEQERQSIIETNDNDDMGLFQEMEDVKHVA